MGVVKVLGLAALFLGGTSFAHDNKRIDPCGCHHQYGLRHCHPKKKTERCEAPVKGADTSAGRNGELRNGETKDAKSGKPEGPRSPMPEVIRI